MTSAVVEATLDDIGEEEMSARHHFELLKQSMEGEDLAGAKKALAAIRRPRLSRTPNETKVAEYDAAAKSRAEELESARQGQDCEKHRVALILSATASPKPRSFSCPPSAVVIARRSFQIRGSE